MTRWKRGTRAELEARVVELEPYREALWAILSGEKLEVLRDGPREIRVVGIGRRSGGVVVVGSFACWARSWCRQTLVSGRDAHDIALAREVDRRCAEAVWGEHDREKCHACPAPLSAHAVEGGLLVCPDSVPEGEFE